MQVRGVGELPAGPVLALGALFVSGAALPAMSSYRKHFFAARPCPVMLPVHAVHEANRS